MNFFEHYQIEKIHSADFDDKIIIPKGLVCVFLWGHNCPNCEISKNILVDRKSEVESLDIKWFHANIYEDFKLATRFGLFGIPVFLFFKEGKKLGKISPFPGFDPFFEAVQNLKNKINDVAE
ncbi:MAG: thioredoxin family protein [Bdellovibrio sp.]|nr:thioredoxin family protein [Bdellovibrio sp.]